jgi:hypothetical protein
MADRLGQPVLGSVELVVTAVHRDVERLDSP